ncbi:DUF1294 domain-containing protein [Alteribacillus sp. HJP-4]|uniref:DUF1294 domain-containing protein n=1 Tax=Alteribacillus sp. HJP-4 TaxID=2775394 RepID=UPI0035CCC8D1
MAEGIRRAIIPLLIGIISWLLFQTSKDKKGDIMTAILIILAAVNLFAIVLMGLDKRKARKRQYRIPEKNFLVLCLLGGAAGVLVGMKIFRHKTKHKSFTMGVPLLLVMQAAALLYIISIRPFG